MCAVLPRAKFHAEQQVHVAAAQGQGKEKVRGQGVVQIMALSANRKRLWRASPDMMRLMKYRSWLRHLRKHHAHFRRCKKRVDVCAYCHKYDKMVMPQARFKGKMCYVYLVACLGFTWALQAEAS